jgi:hypothetical protein
MKKLLFFLGVLLLVQHSYSQRKSNWSLTDAAYYEQKSRTQHKIALGTTLAGGAMAVTGMIIFFSQWDDDWFSTSTGSEKAYRTADVLGYSGCALMLTGAVFGYAAKRNKKIAASLAITNNKVPQLQQGVLVQHSLPSLRVSFSLGK